MRWEDYCESYVNVWKTVIMVCLKIISQHAPGETKETHERLHSGKVSNMTEI